MHLLRIGEHQAKAKNQMAERQKTKGTSLAKGPVGLIGLLLLAYGITALIFGGRCFTQQVRSLDMSDPWMIESRMRARQARAAANELPDQWTPWKAVVRRVRASGECG